MICNTQHVQNNYIFNSVHTARGNIQTSIQNDYIEFTTNSILLTRLKFDWHDISIFIVICMECGDN